MEPATSLAAKVDLLARFRDEAADRVAGFRQREEFVAATPLTVAFLNDDSFFGLGYRRP